MRRSIKWVWGGWLILFLWSATVCAADEAAYQLDTVTVTAEKREENVQDIPSAISVLTETEIEDAGIETISDVIGMIPNMTINRGLGSYDEVTIRGLAASMFTGKNPVVLYVDGVPFDKTMHFDMELHSKDDSDLFNSALNLRYRAEEMAIHSITTYKARENEMSLDNRYLDSGRSRTKDVSELYGVTQELRVQSPDTGDGWKWLAGFYYSDEEQDYEDYSVSYDTMAYYGYDIKYNWPGEQSEETMAVFGQATLPLMARLALTGGLRYERINKELDYRREVTRTDTGEQLNVDPFSGVAVPVVWEDEEDWDVILPKGVLSWDARDNAMLYLSVAKGYLAGGLNAWGDDKETAKFDAQTSWNYELGAKTNWLGNRLSVNAALFYIDAGTLAL